MAIWLKQSTASQEIPLGPFVDSADGNTTEEGLTIANTDIKVWKAGATTLADKNSGGATHISGGIYYTVLDATDTNTLGPLVIFCHVAGALAVRVECLVLVANVYDSLVAGTDTLQVDTTSIAAGVITSTAYAAGAITATVIATGAIDADALAADAGTELADAIADEVYEGSYTLRQFIRLMGAALLGEASGGGTSTIVMRDASDTKTRITATVDGSGNRSAMSLDAS
jgi:hypothetical protein